MKNGFCEKKFSSMLISGTFTKAVMVNLIEFSIVMDGAGMALQPLSSFILSGLMEAHREKAYLITTGYNRNMIRFAQA